MTSLARSLRIIDADTHVTEPADLWTSRLPKKWLDMAPRVEIHPSGEPRWIVNDNWLTGVGQYSQAGWPEYPPSHPLTLEEADPATYEPHARLKKMDEFGIWAQVLYPNLIAFEAFVFMRQEPELALACTQAYNDFIAEFAQADPRRLVPIGMLPFWDVEASVKEIERCVDTGHRGILFANHYERVGLPVFQDQHWYPILDVAQSNELSVNFHVGIALMEEGIAKAVDEGKVRQKDRRARAANTALAMLNNGETIAVLTTCGVLERFPRLNWVSVESGFGYVPYLLESLDWHYLNYGAHEQFPGSLLPSDYFRRQVYGSFWFERSTLGLLEQFPDNFMFETDYPHPTSLSPGPLSTAQIPSEHVETTFNEMPDDLRSKVLHDTAARVYHLD